jgi:hypothetical protein
MPTRLWAALVVGAIGVTGCGDKKIVGPTGGDLTVSYTGPSTTDGAILVLVTGAVDQVKQAGSYQVASAAAGPGLTRVVITGQLVPGDLFKITVKDVAGSYSAVVEAAADRNTFALAAPGPYAATVRK